MAGKVFHAIITSITSLIESKINVSLLFQPPENELQKNSDRVLSEHELRVQRSLQKLNVPDWSVFQFEF